MKTLYIIRHGKSDWDSSARNDFDRPINSRGRKNAAEAGDILHQEQPKPEHILSSSSKRTTETTAIVAERLGFHSAQIQRLDELYIPSMTGFTHSLQHLPSVVHSAIVVGHEPSISEFITYCLQKPSPRIVTSSITKLQFSCETWEEIKPDRLILAHHRNRHNWGGTALL